MDGWRRFVYIISILNIIAGVIVVAIGLFLNIGGAAVSAGFVGAGVIIVGIITVFGGLLSILTGYFGIRAAKDPKKSLVFYILSLISLITNLFSFFGTTMDQGFDAKNLLSLIMPVLIFVAAQKIRSQAKDV